MKMKQLMRTFSPWLPCRPYRERKSIINSWNRKRSSVQMYSFMVAKKIMILTMIKAYGYPKALESWTAASARFPLGWPSRDKEEYQVAGWNLCVASGGFRGQWRLTRDPFGPCPPSVPGSPAFPWIKVQRAIMQNEDFWGPFVVWILWMNLCARSFCITCLQPCPMESTETEQRVFRSLQLVCLV